MSPHWRKPLTLIGGIAFGVAILSPMVGPTVPLGAGFVILAFLLASQLHNLSLFRAWLKDPRIETIPEGSGAWEKLFARLLRMHKRQAQTEASLNEALARFLQAGAAFPEAVAILDEDNVLEWCNPRALTYFGLDLERDRGHQVTNLMRQPQFVQYLISGDYAQPLTLKTMSAAQGETTLSVQVVPYGDREKLLLGRDVTLWERVETMRRDFVANVSHELRTPLTVLTGFLETLTDMPDTDPEMVQRSLRLMSQQATRMSRLVEDLLTLSRLESTDAPAREIDFSVTDLVRQLHDDALLLSNGHHDIEVSLDTMDGLHGNPDEIRSAFGNLVNNAIRYTPEGGRITVVWAVEKGQLVFSVRDTGPGIEAHHIDRLTERFYRVDRSRSRETGGTGLGLAIVKHVLSRHQAKLEIESEVGRGSVFRAVFPAARRVVTPPAAGLVRTGS